MKTRERMDGAGGSLDKRMIRCLLTASCICAVLGVQEASAQNRIDPRTIDRGSLGSIQRPGADEAAVGRIPVFRGRGGTRTDEGGRTAVAPRPLETEEIRAMARALGAPEPGSLHARLTPSSPVVHGKGALVFVKADVVEGGVGFALFENRRVVTAEGEMSLADTYVEGYTALWLWSPADRRYLIDCAVAGAYWRKVRPGEPHAFVPGFGDPEPLFKAPRFRIAGPGSDREFDFDYFEEEGYHLTFSLEAEEAGWFPFQISTLPPGELRNTEWRLHACEVTNL